MKKFTLLCTVLVCLSALFAPTANALRFVVALGDQDYYNRGPGYWDSGVYYIWVPGHWEHRFHRRVWIHGHYRVR